MDTNDKSIEKILIIRFSSLGDILLTTPALAYIRQTNPKARIEYLTRREFSDILKNNPFIDSVIEFDSKSGFRGLRKISSEIRARRYSKIIDLHGSLRSRYITLFSGIYRISRISKNQFKRMLLIKFKFNRYPKSVFSKRPLSVSEKYILTVNRDERNLSSKDLLPGIYLTEKEKNFSDMLWKNLNTGKRRIVIAPGARHFTKRWPESMFAELTQILLKNYDASIVFTGGPDEANTIESIQKHIDPGLNFTRNLAGKISLRETFAVISLAELFISNDSGLMHAASAFEIPQIALFGSTVQELGFYPMNPRCVILEADVQCRPCTHIGRASCPEKHFRCMKDISVERVFEQSNKMLSNY